MISVVVVTWNSAGFIRDLLSSLQAQTSRDFELIIVDNNSSDSTLEMVESNFASARILKNTGNRGFAAGCNAGIHAATGDWVLLLNPDTVLDKNFIEKFAQFAPSLDDEVGMVQPMILFMDGEAINSTGIKLTRTGGCSDRSFGKARDFRGAETKVFCATAGAAFYRKHMLDALVLNSGLMDEGFFLYWEDVDLGWRCRLAGWRAEFRPELCVRHEYQGSTGTLGTSYAREQVWLNRISSLAKNASMRFLIWSLPRTVYDLARLLIHIGPKAVRRYARAFAYGWRQRDEVGALARLERTAVESEWAGKFLD